MTDEDKWGRKFIGRPVICSRCRGPVAPGQAAAWSDQSTLVHKRCPSPVWRDEAADYPEPRIARGDA